METATKYDVKEITWPERTFIIKRATIPFDKLADFFGANYGAIYGLLAEQGIQPSEMPCAIYYSIDEAMKETDLAAAVPVRTPVGDTKGFETLVLPGSKVITTTHIGSYESMGPAYETLEKYLAEHGLKRKLILEEYFSDPQTEKDPTNWKTNIYFILDQK